ncbi:hypothetical protein B7494_g4252 [Chlorociboria aeruginascens]|nr:hypothetical protein B7494_g4252 [Chlorociboria aeruginascens]
METGETALKDPLVEMPDGKFDYDLKTFFPLFSTYIYALCSDLPSIIYTTNSVLTSFRDDGVVYLELRTTPRSIPSASITAEKYIETILSCISAFNITNTAMKTNLILSIDRRNTISTALSVVGLALQYRSQGVVGIDLCGDPSVGDVSIFAPAFQKARDNHLNITIHFAEAPQSSTEEELRTLLEYGPDRIGHVINVPGDIKQEIVKRKMGLELCLSCNVHAKMITGSYGDHHFGWWKETGCPIALSTDDVGVFGSALSDEYLLVAEHFKLDREAICFLASLERRPRPVIAESGSVRENKRVRGEVVQWRAKAALFGYIFNWYIDRHRGDIGFISRRRRKADKMVAQPRAVDSDNLVIPVCPPPPAHLEQPTKSKVKLVDFSLFLNGTPEQRLQTAQSILHGFQTAGFIYLSSHPIPLPTIASAFRTSSQFFDRPLSYKETLAWTTPESNRGYVTTGREKTSALTSRAAVAALKAQAPDLKESYEIGREGEEGKPNNWPSGDEAFTEEMKRFFGLCKDFHVEVMRAIAVGMGLPEAYFDAYTDVGDNTLRLLHYPSVPAAVFQRNKLQVRAGEHTDYGSITLLFQDDRGGLQVKSPSGRFVDATPIAGTVVVNAGDLLARWSNDTIKSTTHRVVEPPTRAEGDVHPARYSIAYFCNPNFKETITAIDGTYGGEKGERKYPDINAGDYLVQRLGATY